WKNVARLGDYLGSAGLAPVIELEAPDPGRAIRERIMTGVRLAEGLDIGALARDCELVEPSLWGRLTRAGARLVDGGLLLQEGGRWRVTDSGWLLADGVAAELMGAAQ